MAASVFGAHQQQCKEGRASAMGKRSALLPGPVDGRCLDFTPDTQLGTVRRTSCCPCGGTPPPRFPIPPTAPGTATSLRSSLSASAKFDPSLIPTTPASKPSGTLFVSVGSSMALGGTGGVGCCCRGGGGGGGGGGGAGGRAKPYPRRSRRRSSLSRAEYAAGGRDDQRHTVLRGTRIRRRISISGGLSPRVRHSLRRSAVEVKAGLMAAFHNGCTNRHPGHVAAPSTPFRLLRPCPSQGQGAWSLRLFVPERGLCDHIFATGKTGVC